MLIYCNIVCTCLYNYTAISPKPTIVTNEVEFVSEAVSVLLEWTVQEEIRGLIYNVSVFPQATLQYNGIKTARLILSYNVLYNVSIAALCGEDSSPTLSIELYHGKLHYLIIVLYLYSRYYKSLKFLST